MSYLKLLSIVVILPLASCGMAPDSPDNIPLAGKWRDEGKFLSVTQSGMPVDSSSFPGIKELKAKMKTEEFCGEPYFRTKEEFQAQLDRNNPGQCMVDSVTANGARVSVKGTCKMEELDGVNGRTALRGEAMIGVNSVIYNMSVQVVLEDAQTGMGDTVKMDARRTFTRLGDC